MSLKKGENYVLVLLIELVLWTAILVVFATQIAIPIVRGTPLFPAFRPERRLRGELADVEQEGIERELARTIRLRRQAIRQEDMHDEVRHGASGTEDGQDVA